jgi:hypothetical protein
LHLARGQIGRSRFQQGLRKSEFMHEQVPGWRRSVPPQPAHWLITFRPAG